MTRARTARRWLLRQLGRLPGFTYHSSTSRTTPPRRDGRVWEESDWSLEGPGLRVRVRRETSSPDLAALAARESAEVQSALPEDCPVLLAWEAWKASADYASVRRWAEAGDSVDGPLWAAFATGWEARPVKH